MKSYDDGQIDDSVRGQLRYPLKYKCSAALIQECGPIPSTFEHSFSICTVFKGVGLGRFPVEVTSEQHFKLNGFDELINC